MNRADRYDLILAAWAHDPPIPRLSAITARVAGLEPRELPAAIEAMSTAEIETLLATEKLEMLP